MTLVLDAGALVALERRDRDMWARPNAEVSKGDVPITHGGVVGQVWRTGTGRQTALAVALKGMRVLPLDDALGRRAGALLARARMRDAIDAAVAVLARDGDTIATSDVGDIDALVTAAASRADVLRV